MIAMNDGNDFKVKEDQNKNIQDGKNEGILIKDGYQGEVFKMENIRENEKDVIFLFDLLKIICNLLNHHLLELKEDWDLEKD